MTLNFTIDSNRLNIWSNEGESWYEVTPLAQKADRQLALTLTPSRHFEAYTGRYKLFLKHTRSVLQCPYTSQIKYNKNITYYYYY